MPFVKLDCGLLDSTLWMDRPARDVFLTALLMAEPYEITEPTPELETRRVNETSFVVPPGWYGFVRAAGVGILRRAGVDDEEEGLAALERLASPEGDSRSPDFEGRRLVRVDGGFIVLNHEKYRRRDYTAADRQKRYRERHRNAVTASRNAVTPRHITQAEEEAEAKKTVKAADAADAAFERFWKAYPLRAGSNPKKQARQVWDARIKQGVDPEVMIAGVERYGRYCDATSRTGGEFVKQAKAWLSKSFEGWAQPWDPPANAPSETPAFPDYPKPLDDDDR